MVLRVLPNVIKYCEFISIKRFLYRFRIHRLLLFFAYRSNNSTAHCHQNGQQFLPIKSFLSFILFHNRKFYLLNILFLSFMPQSYHALRRKLRRRWKQKKKRWNIKHFIPHCTKSPLILCIFAQSSLILCDFKRLWHGTRRTNHRFI